MVKDILQLEVRTTTPTPVEGMIIASGSAGASKLTIQRIKLECIILIK
jgi:hypothetical protein